MQIVFFRSRIARVHAADADDFSIVRDERNAEQRGPAGQFFPRGAIGKFQTEKITLHAVAIELVGLAGIAAINVEPAVRERRAEAGRGLRKRRKFSGGSDREERKERKGGVDWFHGD